jgi:DNA helicase II / ATP-dependent DNA helicase PcrA
MQKYVLKKSVVNLNKTLDPEFGKDLNLSQREAVFFGKGPLLVIAGAGSGKTKTLVHRVAYLVNQGLDPKSILLLTFTRKASAEMTRRAIELLDARCSNVSGGTFHSFANIILRRYGKLLGYPDNFIIMDRGDSEDLISMIRKDKGFAKTDKRFPKKGTIADILGKAVNRSATIENTIIKECPQFLDYKDEICEIQKAYTNRKKEMGLMDYDDLLVNLLELLKNKEEVRTKLNNYYQYILVDEYQDTNMIQAEIVKFLAGKDENVMVVGDDSQSIYSFRGANFKNIVDFPKIFPKATIVTLEENYRSAQPILDLTNAVIDGAREKYSKNLFTKRSGNIKPLYVETKDDNEQSQFICQKILDLREEGQTLNKIAVLFRSAWHSNDLEIQLKSADIPFVKYGGIKFVEAAHIKDVVAYLKIVLNPADALGWQRVLNLWEGVGPKTASDIFELILQNRNNLTLLNLDKYKSKAFYPALKKLLAFIFINKSQSKPTKIVEAALRLYKPYFEEKYDNFNKRKADMDSLITISERFKDLESFLSELALEPPDTTQIDSVAETEDEEKMTLSTIHSAKGLEWHTVFIISAVDGFLPSFQSLGDMEQIEEERRLLYVALTRAKENLFIIKPNMANKKASYMYPGMQFSKLTRFLDEKSLIDNYTEKLVLVNDKEDEFSFDNALPEPNFGGRKYVF